MPLLTRGYPAQHSCGVYNRPGRWFDPVTISSTNAFRLAVSGRPPEANLDIKTSTQDSKGPAATRSWGPYCLHTETFVHVAAALGKCTDDEPAEWAMDILDSRPRTQVIGGEKRL